MKNIVYHELEPIYNKHSKVLVLGSMPSVKSREVGFYYGHPKNRFWSTLASIFNETIEDKKNFVLEKGIALWDVIASCEIHDSSDASIKNAKPNDLMKIIKQSEIKAIFTTGKTAYKYYMKFFKDKISLPIFCLPSTSPANAKVKQEELIEAYKKITEFLD